MGLAAFPAILGAAIRTRSRWSLATTPIYFGITLWVFLTNEANVPISLDVVVCWLGGTIHALYLSSVFTRQLATPPPVFEPAIVTARAAINRRLRGPADPAGRADAGRGAADRSARPGPRVR